METLDLNPLLRLIFAHILCDFFLQTKGLVDMKANAKVKIRVEGLAIHSGIHALVSYLVLADWRGGIVPLILFLTHFYIDYTKGNARGLKYFAIDQFCHLVVIVFTWLLLIENWGNIAIQTENIVNNDLSWMVAIAYLLILKPSSLLISLFIERWKRTTKPSKNEDMYLGLENAGTWIGYIERILILTFILVGQLVAVGFLLGAKSIFRYGDLRRAKDVRTTEYVLIGTLLSFSIPIILGVMIRLFMQE